MSIENLQYNDLFADLPVSADILNTLTLFDFVPENARFDTPILTFQFRKFIGESEKIQIENLPQPIRLEMPRTPSLSLANRTVEVIKPRESMILSFNTTKYISMQIRTDEKPSPYDLDKNGVMVESTSIDLASQVRHLEVTQVLYRHLVLNYIVLSKLILYLSLYFFNQFDVLMRIKVTVNLFKVNFMRISLH